MDYLSSSNQKLLAARYRATVSVMLFLAVGLAVYMVIGNLVSLVSARQITAEMHATVRLTAIVVVCVAVPGVYLMRRLLLAPARLQLLARRGLRIVLGRLSLVAILGGMIGEAVGLLGLVGSLLTGDTAFSWRLGLGGLLLMALCLPRKGEWERLVRISAPVEAQPFSAQ